MTDRSTTIQDLKEKMIQAASQPSFVHHDWYVRFHLEIVEVIALELCDLYPNANRQKVSELVWLHDLEKIADFSKKDSTELTATRLLMQQIGYSADYIDEIAADINLVNAKRDIASAAIEVQIISSADGAAHLVGPFYGIFWHEHPSLPIQDILDSNKVKLDKDWNQKITLPEVRDAFAQRHKLQLELNTGKLPTSFLKRV